MNIRRFVFLTMLAFVAGPVATSWSATLPSGTMILIKTEHNIYARDPAGRKFKATLLRPLAAGGKNVVAAGTPVVGMVKSPWFSVGSTTRPLTLRLIQLTVHGKPVTIRSEDFEAVNSSPWFTRRGIHVTGGAFILTTGTVLGFQLRDPVNL
jgi:hypothetical protein